LLRLHHACRLSVRNAWRQCLAERHHHRRPPNPDFALRIADGLTFPQLLDSLKAIAARHRIRGFDFVEVNPPLDVGTGATSYLGALVVTGFLGFICNQPWWAEQRDRAMAVPA